MIAASRPLPGFARYGGSLALVLAIHAVAIVIALNWKSTITPPAPPPAMMMELAPLPEPQPLPPPVVQPPQPVEEPPLPKVVEAPKPVIELPKPKPKPKPQPPKPQPKPEPKPEPPKEMPAEQPAAASAAAPAKAPAPTPPSPPAPPASTGPSWESEVLGRLARFKEYPPAARSRGTVGQVVVEFTMDGQGRVLDANVISSSGSSLLDRAALRAVNRAQPLPVPSADRLSGGTIKLKAPFTFNLTR